jgi:putative transposase
VLDVLHAERFVDASPATVYATLFDAGTYLASERTMYRLLAARGETGERRDQLRRPAYAAPELLATAPDELWSWDITKLRGPTRGVWFSLYVILDVFSRYVPGWLVATRESAALAERLIAETIAREGVARDRLKLHADRGSSMTSKEVAQLLADLGVARSHSRPHVSNDNPYPESQSKTLKYRHDFPARFGSIEDATVFLGPFFTRYDTEHRHSGIGLLTPEMVYRGRADEVRSARQGVLDGAFLAHPERFVRKRPEPPSLPTAVWINPPKKEVLPQ